MKNHPEIKWTEIARHAMKEYAKRLQVLDDITSKSEFTEKEALEMGEAVKRDLALKCNKAMRKRHGS